MVHQIYNIERGGYGYLDEQRAARGGGGRVEPLLDPRVHAADGCGGLHDVQVLEAQEGLCDLLRAEEPPPAVHEVGLDETLEELLHVLALPRHLELYGAGEVLAQILRPRRPAYGKV